MEDNICLTWLIILKMSQANFPLPPKIDAQIEIIQQVSFIRWMVDENVAQSVVLPYIGEDKALIRLLTLFSHTQSLPKIGSTVMH